MFSMPLPPVFSGLAADDRASALAHFAPVEAEAGVRLMTEGESDRTLVIVRAGELEVSDHGAVVGRVRAGGLAGEMALFTNGVRRATVTTASECHLLVIAGPDFDELRGAAHPVAWAVEDQALRELVDRRRRVLDLLVAASRGTPSEAPTPSLLHRALHAGRTFRPRAPERAAILGRSALFRDASEAVRAELAERMTPWGASRGERLCEEGDPGHELFVLASGEVGLEVATRAGAERVATLGAGDAFGIGSVVRTGEPRRSSAVAHDRVTGLSLGQLDFAALGGRGDRLGSALRVGLIRALVEQLDFANEALAVADPGRLRVAEVRMDAHWGDRFRS